MDHLIQVATDAQTAQWGIDLAEQHEKISCSAGLYPSNAKDNWEAQFPQIETFCKSGAVVAVGEVGIDLFHDKSFPERQKEMLKAHLALARETDLPLIFHIRHSFDEVIEVLKLHGEGCRGVWHCFEGELHQAQAFVERGWKISFSGLLTYKQNSGLREVAAQLPLECLLVETDSPYLSPEPKRRERNEPWKVRYTLECLAEVRGMDIQELESRTDANTRDLFSI